MQVKGKYGGGRKGALGPTTRLAGIPHTTLPEPPRPQGARFAARVRKGAALGTLADPIKEEYSDNRHHKS